ncbi:unnamed protein product, partial [Acanthoscelides obtectus]
CDLVCEFLHFLESCNDPGQLTSTLVNILAASQVACTFKVLYLTTDFSAKYLLRNARGGCLASAKIAGHGVDFMTPMQILKA